MIHWPNWRVSTWDSLHLSISYLNLLSDRAASTKRTSTTNCSWMWLLSINHLYTSRFLLNHGLSLLISLNSLKLFKSTLFINDLSLII